MYQDNPSDRSYSIGPVVQYYSREPEARNFWSTANRFAVMGILAATALTTLFGRRRPRDLVDGVLLAVNESLDSEATLTNTRLNTELTTFFAPVVAAAAAVLAVQVARQMSALQK